MTAAKRRALVHLSVLHAHDLELQTCIATDDERIVAATRRGDAHHSYHPRESLADAISSAQDHRADTGTTTMQRAEGEAGNTDEGETSGRDWLEEMRARDAALQARIAKGDVAVFGRL